MWRQVKRLRVKIVVGHFGQKFFNFGSRLRLASRRIFLQLIKKFVVEEFIQKSFGDDFVFVAGVAEPVVGANGFEVVNHLVCLLKNFIHDVDFLSSIYSCAIIAAMFLMNFAFAGIENFSVPRIKFLASSLVKYGSLSSIT